MRLGRERAAGCVQNVPGVGHPRPLLPAQASDLPSGALLWESVSYTRLCREMCRELCPECAHSASQAARAGLFQGLLRLDSRSARDTGGIYADLLS